MRIIIAVITTIFVITNAIAQDGYYQNSKTGYWWYEKKKEKPEEIKEVKKEPSLKDYTIEVLWNMHPDEFQKLLTDIQKKAVQNPTEENVYEYYRIQDIARRKALAFTNVAMFVLQKYPELSLENEIPITAPGRVAFVRQKESEIQNTIHQGKKDFALLYFYSPHCPFCEAQESILRYFVEKYNWNIKKIDKDINPSMAARFNVEVVPALILVYKDSADYFPISTGVVSLAELEERLYRGIRLLQGLITPQQWSTYEFQKGNALDPLSIK